jgi:hypothetical protein
MDLYELLTEYVEIMELLDRIETKQLVVEASIATIDAMSLTDAQREAHLVPLLKEHELLCAEIDKAIERVARL